MFNTDSSSAINDVCPWTPGPKCDKGEGSLTYRSHDGTCNNLREPNFGRAVTPFQRILLPKYSGNSLSGPSAELLPMPNVFK